ncbi:MAG: Rpn family recombination-promoting nuclease/putative transposase [Oscillospiraceae bacterium]|nr:Rpn family recombination-promoting nuclease/putative transposase [Oscillospiraceae bacterium]
MNPDTPVNTTFKDSFFTKLFSETESVLSLYNALSQSKYAPETPIEITTLKEVFYKGRYNDLSFIVDGKLVVLCEHQSTINPNLPIRMMVYAGKVYDKYLKSKKIYSSHLIQIPRPEFIVLYNGKADYPDESFLNLSDAFFDLPEGHNSSGDLNLTVRVLNINKGHNQAIVGGSIELDGYVDIIDEIYKNKDAGLELNEAIAKAVKDCKDRNILTGFLEKYGGEIIDMLYAEFNFDEYVDTQKEEAVTARVIATVKNALGLGLSHEQVAKIADIPVDKVESLSKGTC